MNKDELMKVVAGKVALPAKVSNEVVLAIFEAIEKTVAKGKRVTLIGFGSFFARKRDERMGRNPQNGEVIKIAAKTSPAFTPGKKFKEIVKK